MLHLGANRTRNRVNVLRKVKVDGQWKFCPAVVETDGRLKDRVQVNGRVEVHSEGVYYIEWRGDNRRLRQSVPDRNHVLEFARLKALELDARKAGIQTDEKSTPSPDVDAMITRPDSSPEMSQMMLNIATSVNGG